MNPAPPYPPTGQVQATKKGLSTGCIVGIVVGVVGLAMLGILGVSALYGASRYMASARTAEARSNVGAIARAAAAAHERVPVGATGSAHHGLCDSSGPNAPGHGPVPADFSKVRGKKYVPSSAPGV